MLIYFFKWLLKVEHAIYCFTNCKVEFMFHKQYYKWCSAKYETYLANKIINNKNNKNNEKNI